MTNEGNLQQSEILTISKTAVFTGFVESLYRFTNLEHKIIHLFNDESENHVMRETASLNELASIGFSEIQLKHRMEVNALVTAYKRG